MVDRVLQGLARLRARDAAPISQGLHPDNARACLDAAVDAITEDGLAAELRTPGVRPGDVTLVAAAGVFTSPIEWAALFAAAGCRLHIKAPAQASALCLALAEELALAGLPVTSDISRAIGQPEAVVGFGSDASMQAIQATTPGSLHSLYGHRFSVALVTGEAEAAAEGLARDAALYDGRGCMAPAAVFTTGDPIVLAGHLARTMAEAEHRWPRGEVDPYLGPEWRRRTGLGRVTGGCTEGAAWAVPILDPGYFHPVALPRMLPVHGVADVQEVDATMAPWSHQLSTCGTDARGIRLAGVLRVCRLGQMQTPLFPRAHDGRAMLGSILG